jgi:hypothetical protein
VTEVIVPIALGGALLLAIEALRWKLRPEQRRLRRIKKIGSRW